jgi:hypothetical protein
MVGINHTIHFLLRNNDTKLKYIQIDPSNKTKSKRKFKLPWWCKIIAYVLSFVFAAVSLFFIIIEGISFGNAECDKWITSLLISFVTSLFLTQPIQVTQIAYYV